MSWFVLGIIVFFILSSFASKNKSGKSGRRAEYRRSPSPDYRPQPTYHSAKAPLQWMGPGTTIRVGNYDITDPLTYVSKGASKIDEASCINTKLGVGRPVSEERGALGYWPYYSRISSSQRANYLSWLANGRRDPLHDIGYAFLYFYGLERRGLIDNADMEEVLTETNRLMTCYSESRSFFGYTSRYLAFLLARVGLENIPYESFQIVFEQSLKEFNEDTLAVALAWAFKTNSPLPPFLAYETAKNDIRSSRSVVVTRVAEQFNALFYKKYHDRYGEGMVLKAAARPQLLRYKPASPSLLTMQPSHDSMIVRLPNVLGLSSQFKPLVEIWGECIEELKPLSREVGRGKDVDTREAYQALPDALKAEADHPDKHLWEQFVCEHTGEDNLLLTTISEVAPLCGFIEPKNLTKKQSEDLVATANDVGFILVPDSRIVNRSYKWDELVALFRPDTKPGLPGDQDYRAAAILLEMGLAVAASDGEIESCEVDFILDFLKSQFLLEPNDARRIHAYKEVLIRRPPSLGILAKRLQTTLVAGQKEAVGRYLVGIAAANGVIDKGEIKALTKFYAALGIDRKKLDDLLASLGLCAAEAVEVRKGSGIPYGERIPPREQPIVSLDEDALRNILMETEQVARMLGAALSTVDEDGLEENDQQTDLLSDTLVNAQSELPASGAYNELDERYQVVVQALVLQEEWTKDQMRELAQKNGVMPAAMIESINAWSDEQHGDFLIEEGDTYTINQTLSEKL